MWFIHIFLFLWYNQREVRTMPKRIKNKIKEVIESIKDKYLLLIVFVITNTINSYFLRIITIKSGLKLSAIFFDIGILSIISLLCLIFKKKKKRAKYLLIMTILTTLTLIINSVYYHYYSSFVSVSLIATAVFVKDVRNAVYESVLKPIDLIYLWQPIAFYLLYYTNKKIIREKSQEDKKYLKIALPISVIFLAIGGIMIPQNSWSKLYKLWNREAVVINFGPYIYQADDILQSLVPRINTMFGHDSALRTVKEYYESNKYEHKTNEYTNIFEGKNIIVIHAESIQKFVMDLKFNDVEVTPNLNNLAREGIFFSNFYSQVGVGTSSDTEFTFNTSLMPSNRGTVFVNFYDREYISIPKLLNNKGYYTYSMHANNGEFWNRNTMHETLGYNKFYSKDSYEIDEVIGLGLSDKSFFSQSVPKMKEIKESQTNPFYGLLIMLSNHTPFSDLELIPEFPTTIDIKINGEKITREYINNTKLGNYIRSVHYSDEAIGELIKNLDSEGLLDNTVLVIYGDHDARLNYEDYNLLYNYNPIEDKIMTEEDKRYIKFNEYEYEINKKVPFIIWTKDKKYSENITTPTGMIDVLPTLGNMIGIHSKYQLGKDIMNIKDGENMVTFTDGSFITSKMYYNAPKGEIYPLNSEPIAEEYINLRVNHSSEIIEISNDIIYYDLIKELEKN